MWPNRDEFNFRKKRRGKSRLGSKRGYMFFALYVRNRRDWTMDGLASSGHNILYLVATKKRNEHRRMC